WELTGAGGHLLPRTQVQEGPRLHCQKSQGYDFGGREKCAQGHVHRRTAAEIEMMHGADDAADGVEDGVEINDAQGRLLRYYAQEHEDERHHDGRKQLQKVLNPQVDDPETPEVADSESGLRSACKSNCVEKRNRERAVKEQVRQISETFIHETVA